MANTTSLFFQDEVLPGVLTEIHSDYNYNYGYYTTTWGTTASVLVLGTAFSGPTNKVIQIYSPEHAMYTFGGTYDAKSHREASLVTGIQDVYDKGCRAIYACRISGKDTYKDFELAPDLGYKLRVAGKFPSNDNKNVYCRFVNSGDELKFIYYKPVDRATVYEKMHGVVETGMSMIETVLDLANTFGFTPETRIQDFLETINTYQLNNVLALSIVDDSGNDVTSTSHDVASLPISAIFEGVYFIGRDESACTKYTIVNSKLASDVALWNEYSFIDVVKSIAVNTDVASAYPITGTYEVLSQCFAAHVNSGIKDLAFLADVESVNKLFTKDKIDYEEVDISGFELYKKLGSGFATTAHIVKQGEDRYVVKATEADNANRIAAINDGAYSFLQNVPADYRYLAHGSAMTSTEGKLPAKSEFLKKEPGSVQYFTVDGTNVITVTPIVTAASDVTEQYKFEITTGDAPVVTITGNATAVENIADLNVDVLGSMLDNAYFYDIATSKIMQYTKAEGMAECTDEGLCFLIDVNNVVLVGKIADGVVAMLGTAAQVLAEDNPGLYTIPAINGSANKIIVTADYMDSTPYGVFADDLNASALGASFEFACASGIDIDEYIGATITAPADATAFAVEVYDTTKYIPYTTTDNLARQLAQHCTYTSLKTSPTHGIINYKKINTTNISAIATEVNNACNAPFMSDLYAKKENGRNMLNKDNMPYDIGKNISVTFGPSYYVTAPDGYKYVSNGAGGYAGMLSQLNIEQAPTNQTIDIASLLFELSSYQLTKLTDAGYVTFKNSYTKGIVVTDGVTAALSSSEFKRISATRIMNAVDVLIRAACEPFIGQQNSLPVRNSIQTAIRSSLNKVVNTLINAYDFVISSDAEQQKLGIIDVDYVIVPFYEIRQIRNRITIRDSLT